MYPSDFSPADSGLTPVDPPLLLGLEPMLVLMLVLMLLAVAAGMFLLGRRQATRDGGSDADRAPEEIHRAILLASLAAMAANSNDLKARVMALRNAVDAYLKPVIVVGQGVVGPLKALDEAIKGEIKETPKPVDSAPKPADPAARAASCGCGVTPCACRTPAAPPAPVSINQIYIGGATAAAHADCAGADRPACDARPGPEAKPAPKPEPKPETRAMTGPEQTEALSKALRAFHDHWSESALRIDELRKARAALSRRPPATAVKPVDGRVWDRR